HRFIQVALLGRPVTVYGDGLQARGNTFVGDCVEATVAALDAPPGEVYNVGAESGPGLMTPAPGCVRPGKPPARRAWPASGRRRCRTRTGSRPGRRRRRPAGRRSPRPGPPTAPRRRPGRARTS